MATKRKTSCEGEMEMKKKRARMEEDRLSNLPDDLQLRVLSSLDTKHAVQTSMLSKTWVSLWTWMPVLDFNYNEFHDIDVFNKFVNRVLCLRDGSAKLDQLTFTRLGECNFLILENLFNYACSHGVKQLEAYIYNIDNTRNHTWPVACLHAYASFESLTSLKLQSEISMSCPFLGSTSRSFKNLTDLYLTRALITDLDPFSGFPVLEKLTLVNCDVSTEGATKILNVHALNLSELTISSYQKFDCCKLTTPRLRFLEYRGCDFLPLFQTHNKDLVPVLDTMVIGCGSYRPHQKRMFDNMLSLFCTLDNVKYLTLLWSTVEILSSFPEELVKRSSPFGNLKCLKLDFSYVFVGSSKSYKIAADVKDFLLKNSPDAEVTTIYPYQLKAK